jgi:ferredoxin-NADP reductase
MPAHETQFVGVEPLASGTGAFHFEKPRGFRFKPGQTIDLTLPEVGKHTFSLVSAPAEDRLTIATRLRGSHFKRALGALVPGTAVTLEGPYGSLTLHGDAARPAVFVAGGIGITPFMSMLRHVAREAPTRPITLVWSNRRPEDAAFLGELRTLEKRLSAFRLLPTMTSLAPGEAGWTGRTGRIGEPLLREALGEGAKPVFYLTGSPDFVAAIRETLARLGVADDDLRSEEFFGY